MEARTKRIIVILCRLNFLIEQMLNDSTYQAISISLLEEKLLDLLLMTLDLFILN